MLWLAASSPGVARGTVIPLINFSTSIMIYRENFRRINSVIGILSLTSFSRVAGVEHPSPRNVSDLGVAAADSRRAVPCPGKSNRDLVRVPTQPWKKCI